jgi:SAM-dependent methyltransferase
MPPPNPQDPARGEKRSAQAATHLRRTSPSVLDLVRLSPEPVFPPGGEALYRQIALISDLAAGQEVLDSACGRGISSAFLAANYGVDVHGVDADPLLIEDAEQRARGTELDQRLHYQTTSLTDLPYRDGIFDLSIGEVGLGVAADPALAIAELARVTKPFGRVVLVQLIWTGNLPEEKREDLVHHLGARPMLLIEWKQLLRDAGVVELHVEDWSDHSSPYHSRSASPFHDMADIFTFKQKLEILRRAMKRWGWRGVRGAIVREQEIHRLLTRERVLGLTVIIGTRWKAGEGEG